MTTPHADPRAPRDPEAAVAEAMERARQHARNAFAEGLEALRALLDAASLATSGAGAGQHPLFAPADAWIQAARGALAGESPMAEDLTHALAEALELEIARWEERAQDDDEARAVLRAFLGLREILWELGVKARPAPRRARSRRPAPGPSVAEAHAAPARRRRVQRVDVEG